MLRKLEEKDIPFMLEWMHDAEVNSAFRYPFAESTEESARKFVESSFNEKYQHFAIINEADEYFGTVSLKNISMENKSAEYAIVLRKAAQGKGYARQATKEIVSYAFQNLKLHKIYLNVFDRNEKAKRFYEKCGFSYEGTFQDALYLNGRYESLAWYAMINRENRTNE